MINNNYSIFESTKEDGDFIFQGILEHDKKLIKIKDGDLILPLSRVIKDSTGNIIGGIKSILFYNFNALYVDMLWVYENYRKRGYGTLLINEVECVARQEKSSLIHLETMDFQAKDFYIKNGFEVFGELNTVPIGHKRYYLKKVLKY